MEPQQKFLAAIAAAPHDRGLRLIFADWLEEQGSPLAELWRQEPTRCLVVDDYQPYLSDGGGPVSGNGDGYGDSDLANCDFNETGCGFGDGRPYADTPLMSGNGRYHIYTFPNDTGNGRSYEWPRGYHGSDHSRPVRGRWVVFE